MINFDDLITKIDKDGDYKIDELIQIIPVSRACLMNAINREHVKARKLWGKWYIKGGEIQKYFESRSKMS